VAAKRLGCAVLTGWRGALGRGALGSGALGWDGMISGYAAEGCAGGSYAGTGACTCNGGRNPTPMAACTGAGSPVGVAGIGNGGLAPGCAIGGEGYGKALISCTQSP
jgi:hypothetical protein